jgi:uncharacterized membrane protein
MARELKELLFSLGINPIYFVTLVFIFLAFSYKKNVKNWNSVPNHFKGIIILTFVGTALFIFLSIFIMIYGMPNK